MIDQLDRTDTSRLCDDTIVAIRARPSHSKATVATSYVASTQRGKPPPKGKNAGRWMDISQRPLDPDPISFKRAQIWALFTYGQLVT